ncbi:MAG: hypothetical protein ACK5MR_14835 [Cumulibacter sp.]
MPEETINKYKDTYLFDVEFETGAFGGYIPELVKYNKEIKKGNRTSNIYKFAKMDEFLGDFLKNYLSKISNTNSFSLGDMSAEHLKGTRGELIDLERLAKIVQIGIYDEERRNRRY